MEPITTNQTPSPSSTVDNANGDGVYTDEFTRLPPDSPHSSSSSSSEADKSVDYSPEQDSSLVPIGFESHEGTDTETGSRSVDKNQSSETEDVVRGKDSQTERESLDDDVETVIKNQHEYYIYCPCCGEDITETVKLVKKSDLQPVKNIEHENEAVDTKKDTRSEDKKTEVSSWFPVHLKQQFLSVYDHIKDKGKIWVDSKSTVNDLGTDSEEPSIDVKINEKDRPSFPKWYFDVFAWLFLCVLIALSVLSTSTSPQQSQPFTPPHLELPSVVSSLPLPSASILLLLPAFAVLLLVIMAMRSGYIPIYHKEKGDKEVDSKSTGTTSEEQTKKTQYDNDKSADPDQASDKKADNQKIHPVPVDPPPPQEQPSIQIANKETHEYVEKEKPAETQAEPGLKPDTQPEITKSVELGKEGNRLEILKSIVYGGLTQSITSLCTVTSAAASGASTLNVLALGVANLSSGLLLIVHSLQELINEKPKTRTNAGDQKDSNAEEEEDRYVEALGRREKWWFHRLIAISSFVVCGLIPPLVYGFSFRRRVEKRQEYKTLAVYAASLLCIVLLSVAKAYVSKKREYAKTLFRYTSMATAASGFSTYAGYFVNQWLEKSGFYDELSTEAPRV